MIFVTGGTGFLGAHIIAALATENVKLRVLKRKLSSTDFLKSTLKRYNVSEFFDKIEWVEGDLLDYGVLNEGLKGIEYVIHAAAIVSFDNKKFKTVTNNNIKGTSNLIDASLSNNVRRFCHISSIAAIGDNEDGNLINESTEWLNFKGNSAYSISKYYSEMHVWRGITEGLKGVILNPSVIIGVGNWKTDLSSLFLKISKGHKFYTSGSTGFVDVFDVANIVKTFTLKSDVNNERFIVSAENISYKNLLLLIANSLNCTNQLKLVSDNKIKKIIAINKLANRIIRKNLFYDNNLLKTSIKKLNYSNEKLLNLTSYKFKSIKESVEEIAKTFIEINKN